MVTGPHIDENEIVRMLIEALKTNPNMNCLNNCPKMLNDCPKLTNCTILNSTDGRLQRHRFLKLYSAILSCATKNKGKLGRRLPKCTPPAVPTANPERPPTCITHKAFIHRSTFALAEPSPLKQHGARSGLKSSMLQPKRTQRPDQPSQEAG